MVGLLDQRLAVDPCQVLPVHLLYLAFHRQVVGVFTDGHFHRKVIAISPALVESHGQRCGLDAAVARGAAVFFSLQSFNEETTGHHLDVLAALHLAHFHHLALAAWALWLLFKVQPAHHHVELRKAKTRLLHFRPAFFGLTLLLFFDVLLSPLRGRAVQLIANEEIIFRNLQPLLFLHAKQRLELL